MATISYAGAGQDYIVVNISHNGNAVNNYKLYRDGSLVDSGSFSQTTSHSAVKTVSGLQSSRSYYISVNYYLNTTLASGGNAGGTWSTTAPPVPGSVAWLSVDVSGTAPSAYVTASWASASGADGYSWSCSNGQSGAVTGTSKSIYVSSSGSYSFSVVPYNSSGNGLGQTQTFYVSPPPQPPSGTPYVNANAYGGRLIQYTFSASNVSNADGFYAYLNNGYTDTWLQNVSPGGVYQVTAGAEWYNYVIKIVPYNNVGTGNPGTASVRTLDETKPTLSANISNITDSTAIANFSASDSGSGVNGFVIAVGYGANLGYDSLSYRGTVYGNSGSYELVGFAANTWYTVGVRVADVSGNYETTTINVQTRRSVPSYPQITSRGEGSLTLSWNGVSGGTDYQLDFKPSINSVWQSTQVGATSATLNGLAYGLVYDFRVRAYTDAWSEYSPVSNGTVNPKTPTINGTYNGVNVTIYTAGLSGTTFDYIVIERLNQSGAYVDQQLVSNSGDGVSWALSSTVVGQYRFRAYSTRSGVNSVNYSNYLEFKRPLDFNWTGGNKVQGSTITVLASDWNNLQARINEFRVYKALGITSFTSVSKGNIITAGLYNQLANSINAMNSPGGQIATVSQNDKLTAYALNRLTACLNTIY